MRVLLRNVVCNVIDRSQPWRRRFALILPVFAALLSAALVVGPAQAQTAASAPRLDPAIRREVVDAVARLVETRYVRDDLARNLGAAIRQRASDGAYDVLDTGSALAGALRDDLRRVVADQHLNVLFSPEPRPMPTKPGEPTPEELAARRADAHRQNFGIERAEHLDGNVGYLEIWRA
jgi:hypothetical protein